jgi:hypothetical protein
MQDGTHPGMAPQKALQEQEVAYRIDFDDTTSAHHSIKRNLPGKYRKQYPQIIQSDSIKALPYAPAWGPMIATAKSALSVSFALLSQIKEIIASKWSFGG